MLSGNELNSTSLKVSTITLCDRSTGDSVGNSVGGEVGNLNGDLVGSAVGDLVGVATGDRVGIPVENDVGDLVGVSIGVDVGDPVAIGDIVGESTKTSFTLGRVPPGSSSRAVGD